MRPACAAFVAVGLCAAILAQPATATTTFTFQNTSTPINSDWKGMGADYHGFAEMPEATSAGMTAPLETLEYQRDAASGIKIAKTIYGPDWAYPSWPSTTGGYQWSSTKMVAFENWLSAMKAANIDVALYIGFLWPRDICRSGTNTSCTPTTTNESDFAHWASDSLNELINVKGFTNVKYIALFAEPDLQTGNPIPAGYGTGVSGHQAYYKHIADLIDGQITTDDASRTAIRPKIGIIGPQESIQGADTDSWSQYVHTNAASDFDIYSAHRYCMKPPYAYEGYTANDCKDYSGWLTDYTTYLSHLGGSPQWADELGVYDTLPDGPSGYRLFTGDYGTYLDSAVAGQMAAGNSATLVWILQDQQYVAPLASTFQRWGLAGWLGETTTVHPGWYGWAMAARLLGGGKNGSGTGTTVYPTVTNTANLNSTATVVPNGVSGCGDVSGCYTMMIVNRNATPQSVAWNFQTALGSGRTFYRYVFNAWNPPRPYPDQPAYAPHWDKTYSGVTSGIAADVVPADSVVIYSTINIGGVAATNLALTGTATASSTQTGYAASNVNDGDTSQLDDASGSWEPNLSGSGSQYVEVDWGSSQTMNRIELDFTGPDARFHTGAAPSSYTVQYWNGSAWVDFSPSINVSSNLQSHRTHQFTAVSTAKVRVTLPGPNATPVNEIGVYNDPVDPHSALGFMAMTDNTSSTNNKYDFETINTGTYTFQSGDYVEYDVKLLDNIERIGGIDVGISSGGSCGVTFLRNLPGGSWVDQNGVSAGPGADLSSRAYATWYHRTIALPACATGATADKWLVASEQDRQSPYTDSPAITKDGVPGTAFYRSFVVKHSNGTVAFTAYAGGSPQTVQQTLTSHMWQGQVFVMPNSPYALQITTTNNATAGNHYEYRDIADVAVTFQSGDKIEYDTRLLTNDDGEGGIDIFNTDGSVFRNATGWTDQNGITGHPAGDLRSYAYKKWYHRSLTVPTSMVGKTAAHWDVASESDTASSTLTAQYQDIVVIRSGAIVATIFGHPNDFTGTANRLQSLVSSTSTGLVDAGP